MGDYGRPYEASTRVHVHAYDRIERNGPDIINGLVLSGD
jgi:hypothetical protein